MPINEEVNNLLAQKDKIDGVISGFEVRKTQIIDTLETVMPSSKIDIEIKELQIEKQEVVLRQQSKLIDLRIKQILNGLTDEQYQAQVNQIQLDTDNEQKLIDDKITTLKAQKQQDPYKNLKVQSQKHASFKQQLLTEIKNRKLFEQLLITTATTALAAAISKVFYNLMSNSIFNMTKLDVMVDNVNAQIDAIKTEADVIKARIARNNAMTVLNTVEKKIQTIDNIVKTLAKIVAILLIVIKVLKILLNVIKLPVGKAQIEIKLNKLEQILGSIEVVLVIANSILSRMIAHIEELKRKLKAINDILDAPIPVVISGRGDAILFPTPDPGILKLGLLDITYKGFKFAIKEEVTKNSHLIVEGHKRHYAVAINRDGNEILKSDYSFTLDPQVLVEQLELIIDERNLTP